MRSCFRTIDEPKRKLFSEEPILEYENEETRTRVNSFSKEIGLDKAGLWFNVCVLEEDKRKFRNVGRPRLPTSINKFTYELREPAKPMFRIMPKNYMKQLRELPKKLHKVQNKKLSSQKFQNRAQFSTQNITKERLFTKSQLLQPRPHTRYPSNNP